MVQASTFFLFIASLAVNVFLFRWVICDIAVIQEIVRAQSPNDSPSDPTLQVKNESAGQESNGTSSEASLLQEISGLRQHILDLQDEIRQLQFLSASSRHTAPRELRCTILPSAVQDELRRLVQESAENPSGNSNLLIELNKKVYDRISGALIRMSDTFTSASALTFFASLVVFANVIWLILAVFSNGSKIYANFRLTMSACFGRHDDVGGNLDSGVHQRESPSSGLGLPSRQLSTSPAKATHPTPEKIRPEPEDLPKKICSNHAERKCVPLRNLREKRMVMFLKHFQTPPNPDSKDIVHTSRTVKVLYPGKDYCFTIENYAMVEDLWAIVVYEDSEAAFCLNAAYEEEHFSGWNVTHEGVLANGELVCPWKNLNYHTADQVITKVEHHLDGAAAGAPTTISIGTHFRS